MCVGGLHTHATLFTVAKSLSIEKIIELLYRPINKLYLIKWIWNVSEKYTETTVERKKQIKNMHM